MGPDCGTALIGGVPLAFANEVPRGSIGLVSASGTGLQEVSCLIARGGKGVSHGIGVGGRDLGDKVGGLMTLMAIDALDADAGTRHIVLISKPPSDAVAKTVLARVAESPKTFTICFLGLVTIDLPANAAMAPTLEAAAAHALGNTLSDLSPRRGGQGGRPGQKGWTRDGAGFAPCSPAAPCAPRPRSSSVGPARRSDRMSPFPAPCPSAMRPPDTAPSTSAPTSTPSAGPTR